MDVLYQLEILFAARRVLPQAARALVLVMDVLWTDDALPDKSQPCSASVAARAFAHDRLDRGSTVFRSTSSKGYSYSNMTDSGR
jgi:hypothetical protein